MEKTSRGVVIPVDMQWSDVGAWDAVWKIGKKDELGNVIHGNVVTVDSKNSLLRAEGSARIAALGLDNICIIAVDDAILVAPMDRVAEVKDILARMTGAEPKQAS
jgi:mannose-1-phosphate guanylyltransferase